MNTTSDSLHALADARTADRGLTRRGLLGKAATAGAAALLAGATLTLGSASAQDVETARHTSEPYVTTTALNLRTGPGTGYRVILVMPKGATLTLNQRYENGYYYVTYKGQLGWAHHDYIVEAGASPDPVISGVGWTIAAVNLRSGPSTSNQVLRVVPSGAKIGVSNTVRNGFRYVNHNGLAGWMFDAYISFSDGTNQPETFTTTSALNLRAEPSTSAKILLVMPEGATVQAAKGTASGWRQVIYKGTTGWAATAYLN